MIFLVPTRLRSAFTQIFKSRYHVPRGNAVRTLGVTAIKLSRVGVQTFSFGRDWLR